MIAVLPILALLVILFALVCYAACGVCGGWGFPIGDWPSSECYGTTQDLSWRFPCKRIRWRELFSLNIYWFAISYLWNSLGPLILR